MKLTDVKRVGVKSENKTRPRATRLWNNLPSDVTDLLDLGRLPCPSDHISPPQLPVLHQVLYLVIGGKTSIVPDLLKESLLGPPPATTASSGSQKRSW